MSAAPRADPQRVRGRGPDEKSQLRHRVSRRVWHGAVVAIQHLLVVDPDRGHELVALTNPPEDSTCFAELVSVLGTDREIEPAGPALRAPGHVMHRVRGPVAGPSSDTSDELAPLVSAALAQERGGPVPAEQAPWCRAGWSTVVKSWGLSQVERIPTSEGVRYLKASSALFAHEPATTAGLAGLAPAVAPGVLAIDETRTCLLMAALPPELPALSVDQQHVATCTAMAQIQVAVAGHDDELRATGAPERGLSATGRELISMLRNGVPHGQRVGRRRQ